MVLFVATFFLLNSSGCGENSVTGSADVRLIKNIEFTITDKINRGNELYVKGIVKNKNKSTVRPLWYVEGDFYSDNSFTLKLGGDNTSINYSLAKNETTIFELRFSSSKYNESDYPNFAVKNLRAFHEE